MGANGKAEGGRRQSFAEVVQTALGIAPDHVVGLDPKLSWRYYGGIAPTCEYCAVGLHLFHPSAGTLLDGVVVCQRCKLAQSVRDRPRVEQRQIRTMSAAASPKGQSSGPVGPRAVSRADASARPRPSVSSQPKPSHPAARRNGPHSISTHVGFEPLEGHLRAALRGRRLVCEIQVEHHRDELCAAFEAFRASGLADDPRRLASRFPAITNCFLVAAAMSGYEAGNLYDNLPVEGLDGRTLGKAFEMALDQLGLERFDEIVADGALRYVARILGHAGIPHYCGDDYLGLVIAENDRGVDDASELLTRLRMNPSRLAHVDKPVGRFLLHGGGMSRDFLDRTIAMVQDWRTGRLQNDAGQYGLPDHLLTTLVTRVSSSPHGGSSTRSIPQPRIVIDPWDPVGPVVVLPPVSRSVASNGLWTVSGHGTVVSARTSDIDSRSIPLGRARSWVVELTDDGRPLRRSQFVGLSDLHAVLFDPDGTLLRDQTSIALDQVRILAPDDVTVTVRRRDNTVGAPRVIEEYPSPGGDWHGFSHRLIDLDEVRQLIVTRNRQDHSCWVRAPQRSPRVHGTTVDGVVTSDGLPVFSDVPVIEVPVGFEPELWRIRATFDGNEVEVDPHTLLSPDPLRRILSDDRICEVHLIGRGPLGGDFRSRFVVVPGIEVERPSRPILPGSSRPSLVVRPGKSVSVNSGRPGETYISEVRELGERASLTLRDPDREITVSVSLPLLTWSLTTSRGPTENTAHGEQASLAEVLDDPAPFLRVRCGLPGVRLGLHVEAGGEQLYRSGDIVSTEEGRWAFDLTPAKDALRRSTAVTTRVMIRVDGMPVEAVHLTQDAGVSNVLAMVSHELLQVGWDQSRPVDDRVVRLWPLSRPWDPPHDHRLADGAPPHCAIDVSNMKPGAYLVDVSVDDGWTAPTRPIAASAHTATCRLDGLDEWAWDPLDVLSYGLTAGRLPRSLTGEQLLDVAEEAIIALESQIALGLETTSLAVHQTLLDDFARHPEALVVGLNSPEAASFPPGHIMSLAIELVGRLGTRSADGANDVLWSLSPPIAAAIDLAADSSEAAERLEVGAGITDLDQWEPDLTTHADGNLRALVSRDVSELRMIRALIGAIPVHLLDPETRLLASFEWLINHAEGRFDARGWVSSHRQALMSLPVADWARSLVASEQIERATVRSYPELEILPLTTRAACAVMSATDPAPRHALQQLREHAPLLVNRALLLAVVTEAKHRSSACPS